MNATHINSSFSKYSSGRIGCGPEKDWGVCWTHQVWVEFMVILMIKCWHLFYVWSVGFQVGNTTTSLSGGNSRVLVGSSLALEED